MSFQNSERLRALTHDLLDEATSSRLHQQQPTSPIFHNFPWLPTPPSPELSPQMEELVELPGSPLTKRHQVIYAQVWLTNNPPDYYPATPASPALSARSMSSNDSVSTISSTSSQPSQLSPNGIHSRGLRSLRRKQTPQEQSLRELRAKQSEVELRRMYQQQTDAYLEELFGMLGSPIARPLSVIPE